MDAKSLKTVIGDCLRPEGFQRKGDSWYSRSGETVSVINLQRSSWGGQYYINLGVNFTALSATAFPKENLCHVRVRLSALMPNAVDLDRLLNLEDASIETSERAEALRDAIKSYALPLTQRMSSSLGVKAALSGQYASKLLVSLDARRHLESTKPTST